MYEIIVTWINRAFIYGSVIMYGALGEILTEKSGNLNLGTPGTMCIGAGLGFVGSYLYEKSTDAPNAVIMLLIALLCSFIGSALGGLIYSFLTITLRTNQNVTGLALTIFGVGLAKFAGTYVIPQNETSVRSLFGYSVFSKQIPFLSTNLGPISRIFFSYGFMMYLVIILAILMSIFLNKTHAGLNLRAVGENPGTADAAGINVTKYKYLATCIGSGISGLGGLYYVLDYSQGTWSTAGVVSIEALGWLAVALVIFATWKPLNAIWGSYLFGLFFWAYSFLPHLGININTNIAQMFPYIVTIIVLIVVSLKKKKENQNPASLGIPYFREER